MVFHVPPIGNLDHWWAKPDKYQCLCQPKGRPPQGRQERLSELFSSYIYPERPRLNGQAKLNHVETELKPAKTKTGAGSNAGLAQQSDLQSGW